MKDCPGCVAADQNWVNACSDCEDNGFVRPCERCGEEVHCEEIPMMGYSEWLCRKCAAAAYRSGNAV